MVGFSAVLFYGFLLMVLLFGNRYVPAHQTSYRKVRTPQQIQNRKNVMALVKFTVAFLGSIITLAVVLLRFNL